jgi:starch synthase
MVAAENGALPQGKVGGVGDVLRDLPPALAARGWEVTVLTPSYGLFAGLPGATRAGALEVPFGGGIEEVDVYDIPAQAEGVGYRVFEHPAFSPQGAGRIYCDDGPDEPFYTDAGKFALFAAATAALLLAEPQRPRVVHLHDWHTGLFFALRRFDPRCRALQGLRAVYSIHNLAFQGTRPLLKTPSSLHAWFPGLRYSKRAIADPRYADCVNPMAAAIRLADKVHTVSPSYAEEIQRPSDPASGFIGGEGLERDIEAAAAQGRLVGILNGCVYPPRPAKRPGWESVLEALRGELDAWLARSGAVSGAHFLADKRLAQLPDTRPPAVLTSIGRVTAQKMRLFRERVGGRSALDAILESLGERGMLLMLGNGDPDYEAFLCERMARHGNFLFLAGYSERLAEVLYAAGDLFLMPSSFEPCGISQMLAMRAGQPCVVHAVGGLKDTVDSACGFPFDGADPARQAQRFVAAVERALALLRGDTAGWGRIKEAAAARRFGWDVSAARLDEQVYAVAADRERVGKRRKEG